jgi:hypothetical protein
MQKKLITFFGLILAVWGITCPAPVPGQVIAIEYTIESYTTCFTSQIELGPVSVISTGPNPLFNQNTLGFSPKFRKN